MNNNYWGLAFAFLATFILVSTVSAAPRVGIVDFETRFNYHVNWRVGTRAADMLTTELVKATDLEVYEREKMTEILKEQDFGQSGRVDPNTAAEIGRLIGLDYIVTGAVTEFGNSQSGGGGRGVQIGKTGYHANVDVRIVEVKTGRIVFAETGEGHKKSTNVRVMGFGGGEKSNRKKETEALRLAMKDVAKKIDGAGLDKKLKTSKNVVPAASTNAVLIAFIDGKSVTLNKGASAGIKVGKRYKIKRRKGVITDPATGRVVKVQYSTVGELTIDVVEDSYADGTLVSNKDVKVGDEVSVPKAKAATAAAKLKSTPASLSQPKPKKKAVPVLTSFGQISERGHDDIEVDAFDEDALEDYYNALKLNSQWLTSMASMTSAQVEAQPQAIASLNMALGMFTGQIETAKIELEDWPLSAKQEGWRILGKKITKYNNLIDKQRKRIAKNDAISDDVKEQIAEIELVTEESLFEL